MRSNSSTSVPWPVADIIGTRMLEPVEIFRRCPTDASLWGTSAAVAAGNKSSGIKRTNKCHRRQKVNASDRTPWGRETCLLHEKKRIRRVQKIARGALQHRWDGVRLGTKLEPPNKLTGEDEWYRIKALIVGEPRGHAERKKIKAFKFKPILALVTVALFWPSALRRGFSRDSWPSVRLGVLIFFVGFFFHSIPFGACAGGRAFVWALDIRVCCPSLLPLPMRHRRQKRAVGWLSIAIHQQSTASWLVYMG